MTVKTTLVEKVACKQLIFSVHVKKMPGELLSPYILLHISMPPLLLAELNIANAAFKMHCCIFFSSKIYIQYLQAMSVLLRCCKNRMPLAKQISRYYNNFPKLKNFRKMKYYI